MNISRIFIERPVMTVLVVFAILVAELLGGAKVLPRAEIVHRLKRQIHVQLGDA